MLTDKQIKAFAMKDDEYCSDVITDKLVQKLINTFSSERAHSSIAEIEEKYTIGSSSNLCMQSLRYCDINGYF